MAKSTSIVKLGLESNEYERKLKQAQKDWQQFTRGIGLSASKFTAVGAAIGAVTGALKVAKDAFMANERVVDEWGRTMKASESLYKGFLNSLNTGSISGFLTNMNNIVNAARAAYDAMDELGTYNAFNQVNESKAQMNLSESIVDYREGKGSKEAIRAAADAYQAELETRRKKEQEAYETAIANLAQQRGVSTEGLRSILTGTYDEYLKAKGVQMTGTKEVSRGPAFWGTLGGGTDYTSEMAVAANEAEKLGQMLRNLNDTELQAVQALGKTANITGNQILQTERMVSRAMNGKVFGGGGGTATSSGPSGPFAVTGLQPIEWQAQSMEESLAQIKPIPQIAPPEILSPLQQMEAMAEHIREQMELATDPAQYAAMAQALEGVQANMDAFKGLDKNGKTAADEFSHMAQSISMVGNALQSIEDPAIKVMGIIAEAIANVALTFATSLKGTVTPWDWIAGAVAGTATMLSTIAAIKSATAGTFATGGTIPGNYYSGDNQIAMVNAGETVLTRAQTNNLASSLRSRRDDMSTKPFVNGQNIYLGTNNYLKESGQGQLVTTSMLRARGINI